jgi:RNA polymerase sigma-70 factor (ECF subfamily)
MPPPAPDVEALLAHAGWIRSLARSLVADTNRADDLVQKTFVAALEHPPEPSTPLRRWLGAVARNFARQDRRAEARRAERESVAARDEAVASAQESVERIAVQRELFEAVLALDEPYRNTVIQRFYEGLPPREIARRESVPVKTVKTRLARGIEKLRAELDRQHRGDRNAWLHALIPLASLPALPASTLGTLLVDTKIKIAIAAVVLAGAATVVWNVATPHAESPAAPVLAAVAEPRLESPDGARGLVDAPQAPGRETLPEKIEPRTRELPAGHPPIVAIARGRVIDVEGNAVGGVPLVLVPHDNGIPLEVFRGAEESSREPVATSRADGAFELETPAGGGTLLVRSRELTTVFAADVKWSGFKVQENMVVVVAPRGGIGGVVVREDGAPIPGAQVEVRVERRVLSNLAGIADGSFEIPWHAQTDERGRFELPSAPVIDGAHVAASAAGYAVSYQPAPRVPALDLRIVLHALGKEVPRGEVVDAHGRPVEGALVSCNLTTAKTDADGRFTIDAGREYVDQPGGLFPHVPDELLAVKQGFLPARFAKPREGWPAFVTLRLEGEALEIRGRVFDATGAGVPNAQVWTVDEHPFGVVVEDVGNTGRFQSIEMLLRAGAETVTTDKDGAFVLGGLVPGEYRVACLQRRSLLHAETGPVAAGKRDVRLVLEGAAKCVRVAGRVVSRAGRPVEGVTLHPGLRLVRWPYVQDPPFAMHGDSATTDADGRFAFEKLSPEGLSFQLISPNLLVMDWKPPADAKLDELEVIVALRCHLQVDLGSRIELAESFVVLDASGAKIEALEYQGPMAMVQDPVPIENGRSPVVAVTEDAKTLVLSKGGAEVARFPLDLAPGQLKIVRP